VTRGTPNYNCVRTNDGRAESTAARRLRQMLPVEIGRALHIFVPSVWQALDISYTAATDLGHRGFCRPLHPLTQGFVGNT